MTKKEFIKALQAMDCPDDTPVKGWVALNEKYGDIAPPRLLGIRPEYLSGKQPNKDGKFIIIDA